MECVGTLEVRYGHANSNDTAHCCCRSRDSPAGWQTYALLLKMALRRRMRKIVIVSIFFFNFISETQS